MISSGLGLLAATRNYSHNPISGIGGLASGSPIRLRSADFLPLSFDHLFHFAGAGFL
jgi:hypothetical protein